MTIIQEMIMAGATSRIIYTLSDFTKSDGGGSLQEALVLSPVRELQVGLLANTVYRFRGLLKFYTAYFNFSNSVHVEFRGDPLDSVKNCTFELWSSGPPYADIVRTAAAGYNLWSKNAMQANTGYDMSTSTYVSNTCTFMMFEGFVTCGSNPTQFAPWWKENTAATTGSWRLAAGSYWLIEPEVV